MDTMERQATRGRYEIPAKPAAHARYVHEMATRARYETENPLQVQANPDAEETRPDVFGEGFSEDGRLPKQDITANTTRGAKGHDETGKLPLPQAPTTMITTAPENHQDILSNPGWRAVCYFVAAVLVIRHLWFEFLYCIQKRRR